MIDFPLERLQPHDTDVYAALGLKNGNRPSPRSSALLPQALALFRTGIEPRAVCEAVSADEFSELFYGQGQNAPDTPLAGIFPGADRLHLFAFTLGAKISQEIGRLFENRDFALGSVLDAAASVAADTAGRIAEEWAERQPPAPIGGATPRAFLYSPGYCGWHISGQKKLFARLRPERIGIRLGASFLMDPLKSISGILVTGPEAIHRFSASYPFCAQCKSPACRERGTARPA